MIFLTGLVDNMRTLNMTHLPTLSHSCITSITIVQEGRCISQRPHLFRLAKWATAYYGIEFGFTSLFNSRQTLSVLYDPRAQKDMYDGNVFEQFDYVKFLITWTTLPRR